ncbi:MAG TPA: alpha/beta hydrolase fold domain-containing protein, partial [Acidimicrobiia bacterium]|nr:alpha/beta hydrolase fold domain-containing protein [Acidimicrobiia bacterium]
MIGTGGAIHVELPPSGKLARLVEVIRSRAPEADVPVLEQRRMFEVLTARLPVADDVECSPVDAGGVRGEWLVPAGVGVGARSVLWFHGGGYIMGSPATTRALASRLAAAAGARLLSVDYRLAPEHPHPAAVEDGIAAYQYLLADGVQPANVVLGGDSAGGGLTVAIL